MYIVIPWIALLVAIITHELAHAYEMRKKKIRYAEISLGIPLPRVPGIQIVYQGVRYSLHPFLIAAFVRVEEEERQKMESLPYQSKAMINGAGIWINVLSFFLILMALEIWQSEGLTRASVIWALLSFLVFMGKKIFCCYIIPALGPLVLVLMVITIVKSPQDHGSLVSMGSFIAENSTSMYKSLAVSAVMFMALAAFNLIPLTPLDGGRTAEMLIQNPRFKNLFKTAGLFMVLVLVATAIGSDIIKLLMMIF